MKPWVLAVLAVAVGVAVATRRPFDHPDWTLTDPFEPPGPNNPTTGATPP